MSGFLSAWNLLYAHKGAMVGEQNLIKMTNQEIAQLGFEKRKCAGIFTLALFKGAFASGGAHFFLNAFANYTDTLSAGAVGAMSFTFGVIVAVYSGVKHGIKKSWAIDYMIDNGVRTRCSKYLPDIKDEDMPSREIVKMTKSIVPYRLEGRAP